MKLGRRVRFVSRGRERVLWLLGAALLIAVLWAIAPMLGWPLWVRAVLSGLAAAAAVTVPELRAWFGRDDTRALLVKGGVAISSGDGRSLSPTHVGERVKEEPKRSFQRVEIK